MDEFICFSLQESAVLEGKLRPQFDRTDARPEKVPLRTTKTDVKLREKQKSFEQLDYQAQRVKNTNIWNLIIPEGNRVNSVKLQSAKHFSLNLQ